MLGSLVFVIIIIYRHINRSLTVVHVVSKLKKAIKQWIAFVLRTFSKFEWVAMICYRCSEPKLSLRKIKWHIYDERALFSYQIGCSYFDISKCRNECNASGSGFGFFVAGYLCVEIETILFFAVCVTMAETRTTINRTLIVSFQWKMWTKNPLFIPDEPNRTTNLRIYGHIVNDVWFISDAVSGTHQNRHVFCVFEKCQNDAE